MLLTIHGTASCAPTSKNMLTTVTASGPTYRRAYFRKKLSCLIVRSLRATAHPKLLGQAPQKPDQLAGHHADSRQTEAMPRRVSPPAADLELELQAQPCALRPLIGAQGCDRMLAFLHISSSTTLQRRFSCRNRPLGCKTRTHGTCRFPSMPHGSRWPKEKPPSVGRPRCGWRGRRGLNPRSPASKQVFQPGPQRTARATLVSCLEGHPCSVRYPQRNIQVSLGGLMFTPSPVFVGSRTTVTLHLTIRSPPSRL